MKSFRGMACCLSLAAFCSVAAETRVWNGSVGNGLWGTPGNWTPSGVPAEGDTLVFENTSELTVENDIEGISLNSLQFKGTAAVTLNGREIAFGVRNTVDGITNCVPLTINAPLRVTASESKWALTVKTDICGDIAIDDGCLLSLRGQPFGNPTPYVHLDFYGTITGGSFAMTRFAWVNFHKPATLKKLTFATSNGLTLEDDCILTVEEPLEIPYGMLQCAHAGALAPTTVFTWAAEDAYRETSESSSCYSIGMYDQTIDRLQSARPMYKNKWIDSDFLKSTSGSPILTLLCTQDAETYCCVKGGMGITLASAEGHSQTFRDRAHAMSGPITVTRGTFVSAGTNSFAAVPKITLDGGNFTVTSSTAGSLAGVTEVRVFNGSALTVGAEAKDAFAANKVALYVAGTGKLVIPDDLDLALADLRVNGIRPAVAAVYSGTAGDGVVKVDWIEGAGKLRFTPPAVTENEWLGTVSDDWNEAGNWTQGVPSSSLAGVVYGGRPVMKDATIAAFKGLTLSGTYGSVPELVIEGTHAFTDFTATVTDAKVTVAAGADVSFSCTANANGLVVGAGGEMASGAGSTVRLLHSYAVRVKDGGVCNLAGSTLINPDGNFDADSDGRIGICGDGSIGMGTAKKRVFLSSLTAAGTNLLEVLGNASFGYAANGINIDMLAIQYDGEGTTVLSFDTTGAAHLGGTAYLGYGGANVTGRVHGELRLANGTVDTGYTGLIAGYYWKGYKALTGGRIVQTGGCLRLSGGDVAATGSGLILGHGAGPTKAENIAAAFLNGPGFYGIYEQSGGVLTNLCQNTILGIGAATGTVVRTGGEFVQWSLPASGSGKEKENLALILGLRGGLGVWNQSGGATYCRADAWIGGAPDAASTATFAVYDSVVSRRCGRGEMTLSGGTFEVAGTLGVSTDGPGALALSGDARLTVGNLLLSNSVDRLDGTLRHPAHLSITVADGAIPAIDVTGTLAVADGAKLTVDASGYTGKTRQWLLRAAGTEGGFAEADVTVTTSAPNYRFKWTERGLCLLRVTGTTLTIR